MSSLGVTGTRSEIKTDLAAIVKVVRENTKTPCAIGFGISTPEQAAKMAGIADGAIVGRPSSSCWSSTALPHRSRSVPTSNA